MPDSTHKSPTPDESASPPLPLAEMLAHGSARRERIIEIVTAVILSLATVASAWSAYQATRWSGEQSIRFGEANTLRSESVRASNRANQETAVDVNVFVAWVNAISAGDRRQAGFLAARFRPEFKPAFKAWLDQPRPAAQRIPAGTPFAMPEYRLASEAESEALAEQATERFSAAKDANQTGDNFVLTAVLFASVLFFAGIATKFSSFRVKIAIVVLGLAMFLLGAGIQLTLPQNIGF